MEKKVKDLLDEVDVSYLQDALGKDFEKWAELPMQKEKAEKAGIGVEEYETKYD